MANPEETPGAISRKPSKSDVRTRFIDETTRLMREHGVEGVSTRLICDAVGVTAPSLYHHFGDLQSLHELVVEHAFTRFIDKWKDNLASPDPIDRIRRGWDTHVGFCRDEPTLYSIIAMRNVSGNVHKQVLSAHRLLIEDFREVEQTRGLRYRPEVAAQMFTASCLGAASMIALQGQDFPVIEELSALMREDVLRCLIGGDQPADGAPAKGIRRSTKRTYLPVAGAP